MKTMDLQEEISEHLARQEFLLDKRAEIQSQIDQLRAEYDDACARYAALETVITALRAQVDAAAPDLTEAPSRPQTTPPGTPARRSKPDSLKAAKRALRAKEREMFPDYNPSPNAAGMRRVTREGNSGYAFRMDEIVPERLNFDLDNPSHSVTRCAEFLLDLLYEDRDHALSQWEMAEYVSMGMEIPRTSAQAIVSQTVALLVYRGDIEYTGQKASTENTERQASPIYKLKD